jgi:hypothetical protein
LDAVGVGGSFNGLVSGMVETVAFDNFDLVHVTG